MARRRRRNREDEKNHVVTVIAAALLLGALWIALQFDLQNVLGEFFVSRL